MVGRPSQRARCGREVLLEWSGGPPGGQGLVERPSRKVGSDLRPSQRAESGWEAFPEDREWSGCPPGGSEVVDRPYQRAGIG